jgi:hypothetical protein
MNRLLAVGALVDMLAGRHLLVVSETQVLARLAFAEMAGLAKPAQATIRAANGDERIAGGGGSIVFRSRRAIEPGLRGRRFDTVVLDCPVTEREMAALRACLAASQIGEIVRA